MVDGAAQADGGKNTFHLVLFYNKVVTVGAQ